MSSEFKRKIPAKAGRFVSQGEVVFAAAAEGEEATFTMIPFDGQVFSHWWFGKMTFDVKGIEMRKDVIPAFLNHDPDKFVGEIDKMTKKKNKVELSGAFVDTEAAKQVQSIKKLEMESSLAFDLDTAIIEDVGADASVKVNGETFEGPGAVIRKAVLHETSFTHFGAVPGAEAIFKKGDEEVEVSYFNNDKPEEIPMSDQNKPSEADLSKSRDEGQTESKNLFSSMSTLCSDTAFVAECYSEGLTLEQFQKKVLTKVQDENTQLKTQLEEITELKAKIVELEAKVADPSTGTEPVVHGEGTTDVPVKLNFMEEAAKISAEKNISKTAAMSQISKEKPELYQEHLNNCTAVSG